MTQTKTKPLSKEDLNRIQYLDNREYQAKFLLDPDIEGLEDFSHLDKNLAITNLKHNPRLHINEVDEARSILRGLHTLNNVKHYKEEEVIQQIGWEDIIIPEKIVDGKKVESKKVRIAVYEKVKKQKSNFPRTFHSLRSEFVSMVNTTAARNGHRMSAAITNRLEKTETLQQQTQAKSKWGFNNKKF